MASMEDVHTGLAILYEHWDDSTPQDVTVEGKQLWVLGPSPQAIAGEDNDVDEDEEVADLEEAGWRWDETHHSWWKQL